MYIPFQNILKLKKSADFDRQVGTFSPPDFRGQIKPLSHFSWVKIYVIQCEAH